MYWRALNDVVCDHVARAHDSVLIASPFIKAATLKLLVERLADNVTLTVYTRWRVEEIARGVSDTAVLDAVEAHGGTLWLNNILHAKLFLIDGAHALIGSANVTAAGLGLSARSNLEILTPAHLPPAISARFLRDLAADRIAATHELARSLNAEAAQLPRDEFPFDPEGAEAAPRDAGAPWLPRFRSPDRLFSLYRDPEWRELARPEDPAIEDLIDLALPTGLDRDAFNTLVRRRLLNLPIVRQIDASIESPQRFGALTDLLRETTPLLDHSARQALLQLVVRWLLYFAPDRYHLDTPNYSEILSLR